jgi:hypothetical protein
MKTAGKNREPAKGNKKLGSKLSSKNAIGG